MQGQRQGQKQGQGHHLLAPQLLAEDHEPPRHERVDVRLTKARRTRVSSRPAAWGPLVRGSKPSVAYPRRLLVEGGEQQARVGLRRPEGVAIDHLHVAELALQPLHGAWKAAALTSRETMPVCRPSVQGKAHTGRVSSRPAWGLLVRGSSSAWRTLLGRGELLLDA